MIHEQDKDRHDGATNHGAAPGPFRNAGRDALLTVADLARKTGKSKRAIYADVARGKWPYVKIGRRVFFRPDTIERFIADHERPAFEAPDPTGYSRKGR